eukprot:m.168213 g.168213  ORF g.168213 m.168213 type:complete len:238 (+) comp14742_c1_seq1:747-1460(+)
MPPLDAMAALRPSRSTATTPIVSPGPGSTVAISAAAADANVGGSSGGEALSTRRRFDRAGGSRIAARVSQCRSKRARVTGVMRSCGSQSPTPLSVAAASAPSPTNRMGSTRPSVSSAEAVRAMVAASTPGQPTRRTAPTAPNSTGPAGDGPGAIIATASHSTSPCSFSAEPRPVLVCSLPSRTSTAAVAIASASPPARAAANPAAQARSQTCPVEQHGQGGANTRLTLQFPLLVGPF